MTTQSRDNTPPDDARRWQALAPAGEGEPDERDPAGSDLVEQGGPVLRREQRPGIVDRLSTDSAKLPFSSNDELLFLARKEADGAYAITLTDEGVERFETSLAIAGDLGGKTKISADSTLADIMERTATREELSRLMRMGGDGLFHRAHLLVLRRKLRGSEKPTARNATISHLAKIAIICLIALGALLQFVTAVQDIAAIPSILANVPGDIVNLHPTAAFDQVGNNITDAGQRVLFGVLVACLAFVAASLMRPFARIYRKDQLLPGERIVLRIINAALRRAEERSARGLDQR